MRAACFCTVAKTVRWLVYGGTISLDGIRSPALLVQGAVWLTLLLGSVLAITATRSGRFRFVAPALVLSGAILGVACCGYFTPFSWWRPLVICQTDGEGQFAINLNKLFVLPWLLGAVGLVTGFCSRAALICPWCRDHVISFRRIWLKSTYGRYRCPSCAAECHIRHPMWYSVVEASSALALLGLGFRWAGLTGLFIGGTFAIILDAWLEYHLIRSFDLLRLASAPNE